MHVCMGLLHMHVYVVQCVDHTSLRPTNGLLSYICVQIHVYMYIISFHL